ncbi:hypothetical protein VNI00_001960 [Paramarasmius palmivorus]|uniref:Leucine-rich repeat-containing protein 40 n=1 Tax=Paramarasmius palmivorus TaxID=297713 RepID=A0AAW0E3B4_9AGAR
MSRIPARSPVKTSTPAASRPQSRTGAITPVRPRTKSSTGRSSPQKPATKDEPPLPSAPAMSIREAIALKRAEAKKAKAPASGSSFDTLATLEDALPDAPQQAVEEDTFGRWSVRETIERGRSSGSVNLSSRSLPCIPSGLFEIHLNITPAPLKSVPKEPPLPPADPTAEIKRGKRGGNPTWFEAQDLQTLKAWNNEIIEIQPEISMFGSLKVVDLHKNQLVSLPDSFGDLTALTTLDLSENKLSALPANLFTLPELTSLNLSHNKLNALPFNAPFASGRKPETANRGFFEPAIVRADSPLPRLMILDLSHNLISADNIDLDIPKAITKLDLSFNPLGSGSAALVAKLATLSGLRELRFDHADIGDEAFPPGLTSTTSFSRLRTLDLGETRATADVVQAALSGVRKEISLDLTSDEPPEGVLRVIVGRKVMREPWELEMERRKRERAAKTLDEGIEWGSTSSPSRPSMPTPVRVVEKEPWEVEAEQGLLTEGGKRRARAQAAQAAAAQTSLPASLQKEEKKEVVKEAWEIEAEQGLLTEGGKRRARAAAAAANNSADGSKKGDASALGHGKPSPGSKTTASLSNPQYYTESSHTLSLPASTAPSKASGHARAFSMATPSATLLNRSTSMDLAVPFASAPLAEISIQAFSQTLRVLNLTNRRMDRSFTLPASLPSGSALLPNLEELDLEGCSFSDTVPVSRVGVDGDTGTPPPRTSEPILQLITSLFPRLQTLNLSYNTISSAALTSEALSALILEAPHRLKGLRHLRLRGNTIRDLDGFQGLAEMFKGNRDVPGWKLEELDLRDNDIGRLPSEMGLLPLDVFLVDGNTFRVPPRRIWEREGTKGLLSWLRGRLE